MIKKLLAVWRRSNKMQQVASVIISAMFLAVLFNWRFSLMLIISVLCHEYGHLWAMKKMKMRTAGIFVFGLIAETRTSDKFPSRRAESFVAVTGPIWGAGFSLIAVGLWRATDTGFFLGAATISALLNLFNLLPIFPLDGGRVSNSVFFSVGSRFGSIAAACGLILSFGLIIWKFGIFSPLALSVLPIVILGVLAILSELLELRDIPKMEKDEIITSVSEYLVIVGLLSAIIYFGGPAGMEEFWELLK